MRGTVWPAIHEPIGVTPVCIDSDYGDEPESREDEDRHRHGEHQTVALGANSHRAEPESEKNYQDREPHA